MMIHPQPGKGGKPVTIQTPHKPTAPGAWQDSTAVATVTPGSLVPDALNGIPFAPWADAPSARHDWNRLAHTSDFEEPPFDSQGLTEAAGVVIVESDGRAWLTAPSNGYGGYLATFAKGTAHHLGLRATAVKEAFEETGLRVELIDHLVDVTRSTSRARYYLAKRVGGSPAEMGWEAQACHLAPLERLKGLLNKSVDHKIVDALTDRWAEWAGWFFRPDHDDPAWEAAKRGRIPARRGHWANLPLPVSRVALPVDIRLDAEEAACLKLGFIPRSQEQKWFAYFQDGTLFEHRSWTGFCITQVHFVSDGEGLRSTHAEVNREPLQYGNTDDAEDIRLIETRVKQLAHLTEADRNLEDPMVEALKASLVPNYLGNPKVVQDLVWELVKARLAQHLAVLQGEGVKEAHKEVFDQTNRLARIFSGGDPEYAVIGTWNTAPSLGSAVVSSFCLDPDYYADENLFCILSEGLTGICLKVEALARAFDAAGADSFVENLKPVLEELTHFVVSVLMGTHSVFFPGRTLDDFNYPRAEEAPALSPPRQKGLFDDPIGADEDRSEALGGGGGGEGLEDDDGELEEEEDLDPAEILELRKAFGLPPFDVEPCMIPEGGGSAGVGREPLQEAASLVEAGNLASHSGDHGEAVRCYRKAAIAFRAEGLPALVEALELLAGLIDAKPKVEHPPQAPPPSGGKIGRPLVIQGPLRELALKMGGMSALAKALGISPRTLSRWGQKGPIAPMGRKLLLALFQEHGVSPGAEFGPAGQE